MYMRRGMGLYTGGAGDQEAAELDPVAYLRDVWARFEALEPRILDLQHRAAVLARQAREAGDVERAEQAKAVIRKLGELGQLHIRIVDRAQQVGEYIGLGSYGRFGAVPVAALSVLSAVALLVAWVFRAYAAEERKLDLIEAGVLTPEEAAALDPGPKPAGLLGGLQGLLLWGAVAVVGLMLAQRFFLQGPRRNPPLVVYGRNPPGPIGRDVHAVWYQHAEDGDYYVHEFAGPVEMIALDDGTVLLTADAPLWEDFD